MIVESNPEPLRQLQQTFISRLQLAGTTNFSASEEMYIVKSEAPSHQSVVFNRNEGFYCGLLKSILAGGDAPKVLPCGYSNDRRRVRLSERHSLSFWIRRLICCCRH